MKITSAEFIKSALAPKDYPHIQMPEIAFAGRSNVGKSSLINSLVLRKKLARTSATPGKTQTINFYLVNGCIGLIDLPGYGFTKAPESVNRHWRRAIDVYFRNRETLKAVFQLIDIRHPPTPMDARVSKWFREVGLLGVTLAVKADKVGHNLQIQNQRKIREILELEEKDPLILYSAVTGMGREETWSHVERFCLL